MNIKYVGPFEEGVIVPDLGREVAQGEVVELVTAEEKEVGARLIEQSDNWARVKPPKAEKAPSEASAETEG